MKISVDVFDNYNRPDVKNEPGGGKLLTESAGYIPIRVQVENMILAGERLGEYRREKYDFGEGEEVPDDVEPDPTRSPSFDLADGTRLERETTKALERQAAEAKAKAKADDPAPSEALAPAADGEP